MSDYTPGARLTGDARDKARTEAARLYGQGCTIASVAQQLGRSYSWTRLILLEAGVTLRARGGSRKKAS